ncbi:Uncharacterised protein [BD1-7 clade bacterium]|uniref:RanBP2-type domain-containing protein n=1 Tax=BD1-7 clade bacterium TaxID=2029982 RepID=A0A5S9QRT0_9GAMM|nr:Uncharacterised protein [BD1-7 clade bacterium]CAA0122106.1 Uncharacterised protein [BD1-7 clade bacterium]
MKQVYTHSNLALVNRAKELLEGAEVPCKVQHEFSTFSVGEIASIDCWPELWVLNDADEQRATEVLSIITDPAEHSQWQCPECDEKNDDSFEICWQCSHEKTA